MSNCLWGNALKRSPGIIRKSKVSYPGPGFLSSATWPSLLKKHYNGLNQTKPIKIHCFVSRALHHFNTASCFVIMFVNVFKVIFCTTTIIFSPKERK